MIKRVIIVAGGSGSRMKSAVAKQFLPIGGIPILAHTVSVFSNVIDPTHLVVVLPEADIDHWRKISSTHNLTNLHRVVIGGKTRYDSVKNGLEYLHKNSDEGYVAIHDGVRPFIDIDLIEKTFIAASIHGSGVAAVPLKDSIRKVENGKNHAENRESFQLIQTPQTFAFSEIYKAFSFGYQPHFTDDASVFEAAGNTIHLVDGDYKNIKLTTPEDLIIGEAILENSKNNKSI